jgi:hypothetical protein
MRAFLYVGTAKSRKLIGKAGNNLANSDLIHGGN